MSITIIFYYTLLLHFYTIELTTNPSHPITLNCIYLFCHRHDQTLFPLYCVGSTSTESYTPQCKSGLVDYHRDFKENVINKQLMDPFSTLWYFCPFFNDFECFLSSFVQVVCFFLTHTKSHFYKFKYIFCWIYNFNTPCVGFISVQIIMVFEVYVVSTKLAHERQTLFRAGSSLLCVYNNYFLLDVRSLDSMGLVAKLYLINPKTYDFIF